MAGAYECAGVSLLEEWRQESGRGIPVAFEINSKLRMPIATVEKHGTRLKPRLKSGDAANDGGCHGKSDRILRSGFFAEETYLHGSQRMGETDRVPLTKANSA
jgi:hypothetical protein